MKIYFAKLFKVKKTLPTLFLSRPISVSFLIRTSGKENHSQAGSTIFELTFCNICPKNLLQAGNAEVKVGWLHTMC